MKTIMEPNIFSPRLTNFTKDTLSSLLRNLALGSLTVVLGLLPILFIPGSYTALGFSKLYVVCLGIFAAVILFSLSILRSGSVRLLVPPALAFFWTFAVVAVAGALLSGDSTDALFGNVFEVQTAGFLLLLALLMTVATGFSSSKLMVIRLLSLLGISTLVLQFYHVLRLVFGPEFLTFGIFGSATISPIGSFNDLAIFTGLVVVIALATLEQVRSSVWGKSLISALILMSLVLLSVINFYIVWLVVGFFSLLMVLYMVSRDTWLKTTGDATEPVSRFTLALVGLVCLISAAFVISGDYLGGVMSRVTNISYLEIRPSVTSTLDIGKDVYSESALLGVGPNRFEDAWRKYKDPVINQTIFWNTNFSGGNGYIPTMMVVTGLAGGIFLVLFLLSFLYFGYRLLLVTVVTDKNWYKLGVVSFMAAVYLWGMSVVYVPGVTVLILAALMTGLTFAVYAAIKNEAGLTVDVTKSRQYGLLLIGAVLVVIISSVLTTITVSKQYLAQVNYANTVRAYQGGADYLTTDEGLRRSQELFAQDLFAAERAQLRLGELSVIAQSEATALSSQRYTAILAEGIQLSEQAIALDPTNPNNYGILSNFYSLLDPNQPEFAGVKERVDQLFTRMRELDPVNPVYPLAQAQYKARVGDLEAARGHINEALALKSNFTDALFLLSQLDIQEGKVEDAIKVTSAMVSIEPANPARYFQLGVLLANTKELSAASEAFETAIEIDPSYANARYFLALTYLDQDRKDDALNQLKIVKESNPDNQLLLALIEQVENGSYVKPQNQLTVPVSSSPAVTQEGDVTTSTEAPDTDLVSPVNTPASPETETNEYTAVEQN